MTSKLTREQLHERARENVKALKLASRQTAFESAREEILADLQLAELALAAMDSEPVAYISKSDFDAGYPHILARRDFNKACTMPVYAAQPAPVVPEEKPIPNTLSMYAVDAVAAIAEVKGWNACRAAMLQAKSLTSINPAPALVSLPKNAKSLTGNSPVNDVTAGKPLTIFLPDISSKAFWSGAGKNETFHPETYRRWAKEAIERGCIIACIDVEVK